MKKNIPKWIELGTYGILGVLVVVFLVFVAVLAASSLYAGYIALTAGEFQVAGDLGSLAGAAVTLLLVVITGVYAYSTNKHVKLANKRIDYEIRQQHTETLRDRVDKWLGTPTPDPTDPKSDNNTPVVRTTEFVSAPSTFWVAGDREFRVIPREIEGDRYLQDLLENHARDLKEVKESIEELHSRFEALKSEFQSEYDDTASIDSLPFPSEKGVYFENWAFERVLILERGPYNRTDLHEIVEVGIENETSIHRGKLRFPGDNVRGGSVIQVPREIAEEEDGAREDVKDAMKATIDRLEDHEAYRIGQKAAAVLDEAEENCEELRNLLVEYKGRPIIPGECEYLREARISD